MKRERPDAGAGAGAGAGAPGQSASRAPSARSLKRRVATLHVGASEDGAPSPLARSSSSSKLNSTGGFGSRVCVHGDTVVVSPTQVLCPGYVVIDGRGIVVSVGASLPADVSPDAVLHAAVVTPGFVDIHNHGVGGSDAGTMDVTAYWTNPGFTCRRVARHGTTSLFATVTFPGGVGSAEDAETVEALNALELVVGRAFPGCAVVEGVHAEGPLVADLGGLPESTYNEMDVAAFSAFLDRMPSLKMMTISPGLEAKRDVKYDRMRALAARGVIVALGHDRTATEEDILGALKAVQEAGQRAHVTHLFNVTSFHHRDSGLTNIGLLKDFPRLPLYDGLTPPTIELIGDATHVSAPAIQLALAAKGTSDIIFVSDAISMPVADHAFTYCGRKVAVSSDASKVVLQESGVVAGSCSGLDVAFRRLVNVHGRPLADAVAMCCTNPARIAGLKHVGTLEPGKRADMLLMDGTLGLQRVIVAGIVAHDADATAELKASG